MDTELFKGLVGIWRAIVMFSDAIQMLLDKWIKAPVDALLDLLVGEDKTRFTIFIGIQGVIVLVFSGIALSQSSLLESVMGVIGCTPAGAMVNPSFAMTFLTDRYGPNDYFRVIGDYFWGDESNWLMIGFVSALVSACAGHFKLDEMNRLKGGILNILFTFTMGIAMSTLHDKVLVPVLLYLLRLVQPYTVLFVIYGILLIVFIVSLGSIAVRGILDFLKDSILIIPVLLVMFRVMTIAGKILSPIFFLFRGLDSAWGALLNGNPTQRDFALTLLYLMIWAIMYVALAITRFLVKLVKSLLSDEEDESVSDTIDTGIVTLINLVNWIRCKITGKPYQKMKKGDQLISSSQLASLPRINMGQGTPDKPGRSYVIRFTKKDGTPVDPARVEQILRDYQARYGQNGQNGQNAAAQNGQNAAAQPGTTKAQPSATSAAAQPGTTATAARPTTTVTQPRTTTTAARPGTTATATRPTTTVTQPRTTTTTARPGTGSGSHTFDAKGDKNSFKDF